ncbi:MAG: hypothetical protein JWM68_4060 [Verrucomicrobiales bacterium]|nr:hypothetical protein [Verrucomicrobiales bacterium]
MKPNKAYFLLSLATLLHLSSQAADSPSTFRLPSESERPLSVFDNKSSNIRDPFFPKSTRSPYVQQVATNPTTAVKTLEVKLVLKGILGPVGARLALINNQTFAEGESGSVKMPGGQTRIRCLKINEQSVTISVEGRNEQMELRLLDK